MLRVLLEKSSTTQAEVLPLLELISEILISTERIPFISLPLKVSTQDNMFIVVPKLNSLLVTYFHSTKSQKVQLSATLKNMLVTKEQLEELLDAMPPSLVILKMVQRPDLDFLLELVRP